MNYIQCNMDAVVSKINYFSININIFYIIYQLFLLIFSFISAFYFMIWFMADDPVASVDLFQEDHPHQLMWKCHL